MELTRPVDDVFCRCVSRKRDPLSTEGILYPSRLERDSVCLVVFPENRRAASRVEVVGLDDHWPEE